MTGGRWASDVRRRRAVGVVAVVLAAVVVAVATTTAALLGTGKRVDRFWVGATVAADGSAQVVEVIDYDFGSAREHGLYRDVPGLRTSAPVQVASPDAPAPVTVMGGATPRIRIGDPQETVSGRHRYVLRYTLDGVARAGRLAWDAVGTGWEAPVAHAEVHLVVPATLSGTRCVAGTSGSTASCDVTQAEPGALVARVDGLAVGQGATVYATEGTALPAAPALPAPPATAPVHTGARPLIGATASGVLALLVGTGTGRLLRRAGRERLPDVGIPAGAAPGEEARIDLADLEARATPSPTLPAGLTAAQGGVLLADRVEDAHEAAWLVDAAVDGVVELEASDPDRPQEISLVRLRPGDGAVRSVLDRAFQGRERLTLGSYDEAFAQAWTALRRELSAWRRTSGLWDTDADRRASRVRVLGVLAGLVGVGLALLGGWLSAGHAVLSPALAAAGGVLAGAGTAAAARGWELRVLTPAGSAGWLQVESLRRFLASSPPTAVDEAIGSGQVGRYTAWAIALGQAQRWSQLVADVRVPGPSAYDDRYLRYAGYGPFVVSGCTSTSATSSSSGSSGGGGAVGGGGVGGGAGGGGGGSW
jgi:hypothetical protein